jgi:hypothetical protein
MADDGSHVEAILQVTQHVGIAIDDRDFVRLFAGEAVGCRCANLTCAEN